MMPVSLSSWIVRPRPIAAPRARLFCFPHAGGNASTFRNWADHLPKDIEVCAIQLPGRSTRILEPPVASLSQTILLLLEAFRPYEETPFALFGHSLGSLISFELARRLRVLNVHPVHLFVSGRQAPQLSDPKPPIRHLASEQFVNAVRQRYRGVPDEVLQDADMMSLWLPTLRADIIMSETYQYSEGPLLECPISSFGGLQDHSTTRDELAAWRYQTHSAFTLRMLPGDHFFIHSAREIVLRAVAEDLKESMRRNMLAGVA